MTRYEFDIACKLVLGYTLKERGLYLMNDNNALVLYSFNGRGVNFFIEENTFMEYYEFINIIPTICDEIVIEGGIKPLDFLNSYDTTGMIPFLSDSFYNEIVP